MRTRFHPPISSSSATEFLRLPLPPLPPPPPPPLLDFFHCFDDAPLFTFDLQIEQLPIQTALSAFLSDAIPIEIEFNIDHQLKENDNGFYSEEKLLDMCSGVIEGKNVYTLDATGESKTKFLNFEVTELDISVVPLEKAPEFQKEIKDIFAIDAEIYKGVPNLEFRLQNYDEAERVVYSIDDLTSDDSIKQQPNSPEDDDNTLGIYQSRHSGFPVFEMDETYLELLSVNSRDGLLIFESIEAQKYLLAVEQIVNDMDTMGLAEFDLLENLSDHLELCAIVEVPPLNFFQEMELIIAIEHSYTDGHSQEIVNEDLTSAKRSRTFEELKYLEVRDSYYFDIFSGAALRSEMVEKCETVFSEAMNFKNFSELVVSHELTLMDDSFKALPVPILLDHEQMKASIFLIQEMLKLLEPQHSSMSDGLYLDWHFLVEEHGSSNEDPCGWKWLQDISYCGTVYDFDTTDLGMLIDKFIVSDDVTHKSYSKEDKEYLKISSLFPSVPLVSVGYTTDAALRILRKDESKERETEPVPYAKPGSKNITFVESMSDLCDLTHLIPLELERQRESKPNSVNIAAEYPSVFSSEPSATCTHMNMQLNQWNINLHPVKMSNDMLDLINNLHAAILENDVGVSHHSISEDKLKKWIRDKSSGKTGLSYNNNSDALLLVLRAIKQTAWYLLYYGVYAAYTYINKLCTTVELFRFKLSFLHQMFEEAHRMAQQDILKIHPSLAIAQEILQKHKSLKILIVAERVFWLPLKLLLTSMGLSYSEPHQQTPSNNHSDKGYSFSDDDLLCTDCCLIFYEFISPSFPVNKYGVVLEYGGPLMSSRLSTMSPPTHGCVLHFIKVDFEDSSICSTICNGVQMPKTINYKLDGELHCKETLNWSTDKIEELFSFIPYQESTGGRPSELVDKDNPCGLLPANCVSSTLQKQECTSEPSSTKNIIIVNTLNIEKDMIVCRRRTYQQILALEKSGSQVIERDLNFPVDVIVNAAVCLAWYNSKNIGKKAALDDAISCLPIFVENLAASILTSLSFSFSGCIMVFEGGRSYIAGVMESSDELYAAAASLGIDLQLFYSYSSEMTDEIILSCIKVATKSVRDLCPKMSDSETLAESFLTTFPSINPLSAHAILSTGGNLVNFLEWSPECRIRAVQRLHVPEESIALLSALSRFGEKENSLSGMTECSSSVSSGTESEYMHFKSKSERKKRKYVQNHHNVDINLQDSVYQGSPDLLSSRSTNPSGAFGPFSPELFHDFDKTDLVSKDETFGKIRQLDSKMMMKHSSMAEQCDLFMTNGRSGNSLEPEHSRSSRAPDYMLNVSEMLGGINEPQIPQYDECFIPQQMSKMPRRNNIIDISNKRDSGKLQDVIGEVINIDDTDYFKDVFDAAWSKQGHEMDQDKTPRPFYQHNLSPSNAGNHPLFPTASETESDGKRWFPEQDYGKRSGEEITQPRDIVKKQMSGVQQKGIFEECVLQNNNMSFDGPSIPCRRTPLSNAIDSTQLQQRSPWTIEFLNRMREKSKQKQQSNPSAMSSLSCGSVWNEKKTTKRKSPSILESYKFRGGKTTKNGIELKKQRQFVKPSNAFKAEKPPIPFASSWSPIDNRERRKLAFTTNGNGGQSKLVWKK